MVWKGGGVLMVTGSYWWGMVWNAVERCGMVDNVVEWWGMVGNVVEWL